ncbi:hypothetical protein [Chimaeribacter coloradensis]|uniref:hypothetical protein n=1 Tax=Chimaeribacter coloradensis TaxID=2060068 RepID=UPI0011AEFAFF|nr:hypothetical protein [Chimaeribacter coloradensis]
MSLNVIPAVLGLWVALVWNASAAPVPTDMHDAQENTQHAEPLPMTLSQALTAKASQKAISTPRRYGVLESQEWHTRLPGF